MYNKEKQKDKNYKKNDNFYIDDKILKNVSGGATHKVHGNDPLKQATDQNRR